MNSTQKRACFLIFAICGTPWVQAQPSPERSPTRTDSSLAGLLVEQESNGVPNRPSEKPGRQVISVTPRHLKLEDDLTGISYLFHRQGDSHQIFEISPDGTQYRNLDEVNRIQQERDYWERTILDQKSSLRPEEYLRILRDKHIREGLVREVVVEKATDPVEILGRPTEHYIVKENGRTIVDVRVARDFDLEIPFFEFYRHVGAFSDAVLEKLQTIPGVPLWARITVVTGNLNYTITAQVRDIRPTEFHPTAFELPAGAQEIKETPFAQDPISGEQVEKASPPGGKHFHEGQWYYFASRKNRKEFLRRLYSRPERGDGK